MTEVHTAQGGTPPTDGIDYEAAFKLAWSAFTRKPVELIVGMLIATLLAFLIITVGAVALGVNHQALQAVRGRDIKIGDALAGFSEFGMSLGAVLLVILAVIIGTALCVVPGIIAAFGFYWTFMCMADDLRLGAVDSMKRAFAIAKTHPGPTLVVLAVNFILSLLGGAVAVGFLVTTPLGLLFAAAVFDQMKTPAPEAPAVVTPTPVSPPSAPTQTDS